LSGAGVPAVSANHRQTVDEFMFQQDSVPPLWACKWQSTFSNARFLHPSHQISGSRTALASGQLTTKSEA